MSFGKIRVGGFYLLLISGVACNGQGFKGSTSSQETEETSDLQPETSDAAGTETDTDETAATVDEAPISTSVSKIPVAECREKLNYDPSQILCSLRENDKKTIWDNTAGWKERVDSLKNRAAAWISPLAALNNGTSLYCPFVPDSDRLIFVSNFTLSEDSDVTIEAVIDDIGTVRIWKDADAKQEVYLSAKAPKVDGTVKLSKGFYAVVADGVDSGKSATGMIMTLFDGKGATIRQTEASATDWCIFRVKADTDVAAFVNAASSCRSCLVGKR